MTDPESAPHWPHDALVDARDLICPMPVLKARKRLMAMAPGETLLLVATDRMAKIDVPHFCNQAGHRVVASAETGDTLRFLIERGPLDAPLSPPGD